MLKIEQAIEAVKELKEISESEDFKADMLRIKQLKGLPVEEKIAAIKELKVVVPPLAKLVTAFTGEKIDQLVADIVEAIEIVFDEEQPV